MRGIFPYSVRVTLFWGILVLAFWFIMPDRDGTWTAGTLRAAEGDELLEKGIAAQNAGNWAEAISSLEQYIKNQPNSPRRNEAELYLGYSYLVRNNYVDPKDGATARSHFDYIIQQGVTAKYYREACVHYSHSLYCLMRYKEAEERFKKFIADFPNDDYLQYIYFYLGVCESHLGNPRESLNYFQTGMTKFPQTPLLPSYKLEYAVSLGKDGRYAEADSQLAALASDPNYEFADKAALQRALLRLVQEDYNGAISMLDSFISAKKNDPKAQNMVAEAWQDKAYCYVLLNQNENALQAVEAIEKLPVEIRPEIVLLKIRILCNLNRGMEATMLLTNLQGTAFGGNVPDVITYYQAMILLSQKRWDESITILNSLLKVTSTDQKFSVDYFEQPINEQQNRLLPFDFVDACGILILAYANRSVSTGNAVDKQTQANLFQIITQYAQQQKSNLLQKVVVKIGQKRDAVFQNQGTVATATPVTPGQISYSSLPIDNSISPNGNPGGAQGVPGGPQGNPGGPQNNPGSPQTNPGGTSGVPAQPGTGTGEETAKITEENANAALKRANILYLNQEYERVNELLLELMTTSVSFWDDIPVEAPIIALLRAKTLFKLGFYSEAQLMCQEIIKHAPSSSQATDASFYLGFCEDHYGRHDQAIEYFQRVVRSPNESEYADAAYYFLAWNELERKNTSTALVYFDKIYRLYRASIYWGHAAWAMAQIHYNEKDYRTAERLVNEALLRQPDESIVDYLLFLKGEIALQLNDYDRARTAFEMIIDQYPESEWVSKSKNRLARIEEQETNLAEHGGNTVNKTDEKAEKISDNVEKTFFDPPEDLRESVLSTSKPKEPAGGRGVLRPGARPENRAGSRTVPEKIQ